MQKTSAELIFRWFEEAWTKGSEVPDSPSLDGVDASAEGVASVAADSAEVDWTQHGLKEGLTDIRLDFESFASNGDQVTCAMVVKARDKISGEPVSFRSTLDGQVRDGQLVSASNDIDYFIAE